MTPFTRLAFMCSPRMRCASEQIRALRAALTNALGFGDGTTEPLPALLHAADRTSSRFEAAESGTTLYFVSMSASELETHASAGEVRLPPHYIWLQYEQMTNANYVQNEHFRRALANALWIWDYAACNAVVTRRLLSSLASPPPVSVVPFSIHLPSLLHAPLVLPTTDDGQPDDVLFLGAITSPERKACFLLMKRKYGLRVRVVRGTYDADRERLIRAAKVCINVHHHRQAPGSVLETCRLNLLLANGACVVSERSTADSDAARLYEPAVVFVNDGDFDALAQQCVTWLAHPEQRAVQRRRALAFCHDARVQTLACVANVVPTLRDLTLPPRASERAMQCAAWHLAVAKKQFPAEEEGVSGERSNVVENEAIRRQLDQVLGDLLGSYPQATPPPLTTPPPPSPNVRHGPPGTVVL